MDRGRRCEWVLLEEDIRAAINGEEMRPKRGMSCEIASDTVPENLGEAMAKMERACIRRAIEKNGGDKNKAAAQLGIPLRTLYYKCRKLDI